MKEEDDLGFQSSKKWEVLATTGKGAKAARIL
jgi:hypothetical protein